MKTTIKTRLNTPSKLEQQFTLASTVLFILPILSYAYLSYLSSQKTLSLLELFEKDPLLTLNMIAIFASVYLAYILTILKKKLRDTSKVMVVVINLIIMLASQMLVLNSVAIAVLVWIIYCLNSQNYFEWKDVLKSVKHSVKLTDLGGSIAIFCFNFMILALTIRINFL